MSLFNFFKRKTTYTNEEVEKEYRKVMEKVQHIDGGRCSSLVRDMKEYAELTCYPQKADDLLAKKAEFMRIYAFRAYQWRCYHTLAKNSGVTETPLWAQKWQDYEQSSRLKAQKVWRTMLSHTR